MNVTIRIRSCIERFPEELSGIREMVIEYSSRVSSLCLSDLEEMYIRTFDHAFNGGRSFAQP